MTGNSTSFASVLREAETVSKRKLKLTGDGGEELEMTDEEGLPPFIQIQVKPKTLIRDFENWRRSQVVAPTRAAMGEMAIIRFLEAVGGLTEESKRFVLKKYGKIPG